MGIFEKYYVHSLPINNLQLEELRNRIQRAY